MNLPKIDLIVTWPINTDYPLWRKFLLENRDKFNDVFIVLMNPHFGHDYSQFLINELKDVATFIESSVVGSGEDWRSVAVNAALKKSTSEWVWFTEQDFYTILGFWESVEECIKVGYSVIGVMEGERLHPCSLFVKREILNKTSLDFGILSSKYDHFGKIQEELTKICNISTISPYCYYHYSGMSHNWRLISEGSEPNYKKDEFLTYIGQSILSGVTLDPEWERVAREALKKYV